MYVADDPAVMVGQGRNLDATTTEELTEIGVNETAVMIPTETVVRSVTTMLQRSGAVALADQLDAWCREQGIF